MLVQPILADLPPPFFERWVLEQPIPLAVVLAAAAAVVMAALVRRGRGRAGAVAAGVLLVLAGGVLLLGYVVRTPRERLADLTVEFVQRCFASDRAGVSERVDSGLIVASAGEAFTRFAKAELVALVGNFHALRVRDWRGRGMGAAMEAPDLGRTRFTLRVRTDFLGDQPMPSTWEFTWRRSGEGEWRLIRLECLTMWGRPPTRDWETDALRFARMRPGESGGLRPDEY